MSVDTKKEDLMLVEEFKNGSSVAFEQLVLKHESKVHSIALRYTKKSEDAEEVVQDVFMTLYNKVDKFEGKSAFSSWLYRIVVNTSLMKLRKNRQDKSTKLDDMSLSAQARYNEIASEDMMQADSRSIQHETRGALENAINRLPDEYKAVYIMRDVDGLTNQEVSEMLDISVAAIKSRLHRARLMLKKKLEGYWNDYSGIEPMRDMTKTHMRLVANG